MLEPQNPNAMFKPPAYLNKRGSDILKRLQLHNSPSPNHGKLSSKDQFSSCVVLTLNHPGL